MLTQSMDAVVKALTGVLPPNAIAQLSSALGNCATTLAHRGNINVQPAPQGNRGGSYGGDTWNINEYIDILPPGGDGGTNNWNNYNYGGNQFYFPTNQEFQVNQFYGGPTNYFGGNTYGDNITTQNLVTNNINTTTINGSGIPGAPGPAGPAGSPGAAGADGAAGGNGDVFNNNFFTTIINQNGKKQRLVENVLAQQFMTNVEFDPDACDLVNRQFATIFTRTYELVDA